MSFAPTELGFAGVAVSARGVVCLQLADDLALAKACLREALPNADLQEVGDEGLEGLLHSLHTDQTPAVPLDLQGTPFQVEVWLGLTQTRWGQTLSYSELTRSLGRPESAVRAVAGAVAANPIAVLVPCHRVLRRDGGLGGFRWGIARKRRLLAREGRLSLF
ncbi:MAG: methylated-DNA--[protein]-cysteine S-methyltransferase [Myxococcota bacterium]|nr:methylated-DNA--[protein]-cysteine S-methyltransferase [Myxococcota bacterium]